MTTMPRTTRHRVKRFAYRNALTLTVLAVLAFVFYALFVWERMQ